MLFQVEYCRFPEGSIPEVRVAKTLKGCQLESFVTRLPICTASVWFIAL